MSELIQHLDDAVAFIATKTKLRPQVGVVLGSGLGAFADSIEKPTRIPFQEIPHFPTATAISHKGELVIGLSRGTPVAVMAGRVHYYEGYSLQQVVFPVRVLGRLGIKVVVLTNASGSVNINYKPAELMIIDDHINLMGSNPMIGKNEDALGERFFDLSETYDLRLREMAARACSKFGITARFGVYAAFTGPSYETPAEIKMARVIGADAIGMSTVPEAIAARHMKLRVLGLSCITNMAAGVSKRPLDHREVIEVGQRVQAALMDVLGMIIEQAAMQA